MCRIIGILETPLVTPDLHWAILECGIHLKAQLQPDGGSFFKARAGQDFPCPIHQAALFEESGLHREVLRYGDRQNCDVIIGEDPFVR